MTRGAVRGPRRDLLPGSGATVASMRMPGAAGTRGRSATSVARWMAFAALLAAALLKTAPAAADDAAQARFHDERARAHYEAGRFEQALEEFFREERLAPNPRTLFNIALCFDRLHREDEAYLFYQEYAESDDADTARRSFVTSALARLEPRLSRVRIETTPAGAAIYVDQRDHGSYGVTPRVLALPEGAHHVVLELDGHRIAEADVTLVRGEEVTLSLPLVRIEGRLAVSAPAAGEVAVRDDAGRSVASGPAPFEASLPPGAYTVEVAAEGYALWREVVRVEADGTRTVEATPTPLPPPTGELTVTASIPGALIEVDGEPAGFAPAVLSDVGVGEHRVVVRSDGLDDFEGTVAVEPDIRSWLTVSLVPPSRTTRSELTWVVGGLGVASAITWGVLLGLATANRDTFARGLVINNDPSLTDMHADLTLLRQQGMALDTAADVALGVSVAALGTAVLLYFATESTEASESSAALAREER